MKILFTFLAILLFTSCTDNKKKLENETSVSSKIDTASITHNNRSSASENTLFDIEGSYALIDTATSCKLSLNLFYKSNELNYQLITNTKKYADKAIIELNEKKDGYYITFKNIEWSENEGTLNDEGEPIDKEISLPQDIQGVMYKNEITIQNSGNSMNYYVKIGDCDLKFIRLIKK